MRKEIQKTPVINYDKNMEAKVYTEEMIIEIDKNNLDNDIPRQDAEIFVEKRQVEFSEINVSNANDQTNVVMGADEVIEEIEINIEVSNSTMDTRREGYEKVVEKLDNDINEYHSELSDNNVDNGFESKDYTENMVDQKNKLDKTGSDKQVINEDKTAGAIDDHIESIMIKKKLIIRHLRMERTTLS